MKLEKTTTANSNHTHSDPAECARQGWVGQCREFVVRAVRKAITSEFMDSVRGYEHMLQQALREAEAAAWQTPFPHLFFPDLAREKAVAVTNWAAHQQRVRPTSGRF